MCTSTFYGTHYTWRDNVCQTCLAVTETRFCHGTPNLYWTVFPNVLVSTMDITVGDCTLPAKRFVIKNLTSPTHRHVTFDAYNEVVSSPAPSLHLQHNGRFIPSDKHLASVFFMRFVLHRSSSSSHGTFAKTKNCAMDNRYFPKC